MLDDAIDGPVLVDYLVFRPVFKIKRIGKKIFMIYIQNQMDNGHEIIIIVDFNYNMNSYVENMKKGNVKKKQSSRDDNFL